MIFRIKKFLCAEYLHGYGFIFIKAVYQEYLPLILVINFKATIGYVKILY